MFETNLKLEGGVNSIENTNIVAGLITFLSQGLNTFHQTLLWCGQGEEEVGDEEQQNSGHCLVSVRVSSSPLSDLEMVTHFSCSVQLNSYKNRNWKSEIHL